MSDKKKHCLKAIAVFVMLALAVTGLCLLCDWLFDERVKEESFQNVITELTDEEETIILDTVLIEKDCADLLAAYIPIVPHGDNAAKEYVFVVESEERFARYLEKFNLSDESEKAEDISIGDNVFSCRKVYTLEGVSDFHLYEYGQGYWLIKQGEYIRTDDKQTVENISYKYAFKRIYGFEKPV